MTVCLCRTCVQKMNRKLTYYEDTHKLCIRATTPEITIGVLDRRVQF